MYNDISYLGYPGLGWFHRVTVCSYGGVPYFVASRLDLDRCIHDRHMPIIPAAAFIASEVIKKPTPDGT